MIPIPHYPAWRCLGRRDRPVVEAATRAFPLATDVAFSSLYAWDTDDSCLLSRCGDNLLVCLKSYTTDERVLTFIGRHAVVDTAHLLLAHARERGLPARLELIPAGVVAADPRLAARFAVTADQDHFDYLYAAADWAHLPNPGFREHRRLAARCRERTPLARRELDLGEPASQQAIVDLFDRWARQKGAAGDADHGGERAALRRICHLAGDGRIKAFGFCDGEHLAGFTIWEVLPGTTCALVHFQLADRDYRGLSSWQAHELGRVLLARGVRSINFEEDLGIPGLRAWKRSLRPCRLVRKYVITERDARR
jgi:hypothetical protein